MDDETKSVADYKIIENGFIVMMTVKVSNHRPITHTIRSVYFYWDLDKLFLSPTHILG